MCSKKSIKHCIHCNGEIKSKYGIKYCTKKCFIEHNKQENHYKWKGGLVDKNCLYCGKVFKIEPCDIKIGGGKFCSKQCFNKYNTGKHHSNWTGGTSNTYSLDYLKRGWYKIRKEVYKRDNYKCMVCNKTSNELRTNSIKLHAHHIVPYRISKDDSMDNLITLCGICHRKEEIKYYKTL